MFINDQYIFNQYLADCYVSTMTKMYYAMNIYDADTLNVLLGLC